MPTNMRTMRPRPKPCGPLEDCRPCIPVVYKKLKCEELLEGKRSGFYVVVGCVLAVNVHVIAQM
jgi:hypothetical protein